MFLCFRKFSFNKKMYFWKKDIKLFKFCFYKRLALKVIQSLSHVWLCNPTNYGNPGSSVLHCLPEFALIHAHWVSDAIQPSHPLLSPSPQSCSASGSFPMSQFFTSGGQSLGASDAATTLPKNIQDWFPLGLTGFISCNPRDFKESSPAPWFKSNNSLVLSLLYDPTLTFTHNYWKNHSFAHMDLVSKVRSLLFNTLSRFVVAFLLRSKYLLISWV